MEVGSRHCLSAYIVCHRLVVRLLLTSCLIRLVCLSFFTVTHFVTGNSYFINLTLL
jgi:hypothetical protein